MTNWDRIIASAPVNKSAAVVAGGKSGLMPLGPQGTPQFETWDAPPKCQPVPKRKESLVGVVFGKMKVVGYHGSHKKHGSQWLCRCACGLYELRRSKAVKNAENNADQCRQCRHVVFLRRNNEYLRTGRNKEDKHG